MDLTDPRRICLAAMNITAGFEGGRYSSYQTYDSGLISYGRFQFTLASGNLERLLKRYLAITGSDPVIESFMTRIERKDPRLRAETRLRDHLISLASNKPMQEIQDAAAVELFWNRAMEISVQPRNLHTPLYIAMIFDMAIQHGLWHDLINLAERQLGIPINPKTPPTQVGKTEQELAIRTAYIREARLAVLADSRQLYGLKPRGAFWVAQVMSGNWFLQGNAEGKIQIKPRLFVQIDHF